MQTGLAIGPEHILRNGDELVRMLVCITMYDESFDEAMGSLFGIYQNLCELLIEGGNNRFVEGSFAVILIADGMEKVSKEFL